MTARVAASWFAFGMAPSGQSADGVGGNDAVATYRDAGVDILAADAVKREMAAALSARDPRILNGIGPFATLIDARFADYREPVLVMKTEEPGSKQKLAVSQGSYRSICFDLVHHLIDDIVVMGARPVAVQDAIVCGQLDSTVVATLVRTLGEACREQDCTLTGGETSEQPGVLDAGTYVITANVLGVAERSEVIDGAAIAAGDTVMALASSGVHTNGISLIRRLFDADATLATRDVSGEPFLQRVLEPHRCYRASLESLFGCDWLHGLAHITGGGIHNNLARVLPEGVQASIDLERLRVLPIFGAIRQAGTIADEEMLHVYNLGVGMTAVIGPGGESALSDACSTAGVACYPIGEIVERGAAPDEPVIFSGSLRW